MRVKLLAILIALALLFSLGGFSSVAEEAEALPIEQAQDTFDSTGLMNIADNDTATLYINLSTANIVLYDKKSGEKWTAFPEESSVSSLFTSMIEVSYITENGVAAKVRAPSNESRLEIRKIENGIKIIFSFTGEGADFTVPMTFGLKESYAEASVVYSEIEERSASRITDIELLPNLMYGTKDDSGYVFIPDGSGAIINYSDAGSKNETYSARIYGDDPCQDLIYPKITDSKTALLPVYGAVKGNSALLAVISEADAYATVDAASVSDSLTVSSQFVYREHDMTGIQSSSGGERTLDIVQSTPITSEPTVRFYLLSGDNASYSGMANTYRNYLIENEKLIEKNTGAIPAVSVMAFGAVPEKKVVFGFPITTVRKATTFNELTDLYSKLTENGAESPSFYLYGFLSGGYGARTVLNENYIEKLGGKKGYKAFRELVGSDNVYTVYNTERSYGRAFDFLRFKDYMSSLNQTTVELHYRSLSSGLWHSKFGSWSFYTIPYQQKITSKLIKNLSADSSIALEHYGEELLSDFTSSSSTGRNDYVRYINQAIGKYKAKGINVALEGGNACVATVADEIYGIPLESSKFAIESYSVPFYTMVFHSYKKLSSSPVNLESDREVFALKALEQGVSATWTVSGCDPYDLKNTVFNFLYNSKIDDILPHMQKYIKDYSEIHKTLAAETIVSHEYIGDLSLTEYSNGWKLVCNYGETEQTYNNISIAPFDYRVIK